VNWRLASVARDTRRLGSIAFFEVGVPASKIRGFVREREPIDATSPMFGSHILYNAFLSFLNRRSTSIAVGKQTNIMYEMTVPAMTPLTPHD
jgi:hypothetical protein